MSMIFLQFKISVNSEVSLSFLTLIPPHKHTPTQVNTFIAFLFILPMFLCSNKANLNRCSYSHFGTKVIYCMCCFLLQVFT